MSESRCCCCAYQTPPWWVTMGFTPPNGAGHTVAGTPGWVGTPNAPVTPGATPPGTRPPATPPTPGINPLNPIPGIISTIGGALSGLGGLI